ncbi:MAG: hypothetical protein KF858_13625 [Candidatus Sumerlaeia bacterium]|nr:hypothetical protein [Candidatus Sumerlaeia bacterium]
MAHSPPPTPHDGPWHRIDLGDLDFAAAALDELLAALRAAGSTDAPITRVESTTGLHCHLIAYFPPSLADLARTHGATPCTPPLLPPPPAPP